LFFNAAHDVFSQFQLHLVQDELVLKKDIQDVQSLFSKIMSQLDDIETNRRNNYSTEPNSIECSKTYARTNLNRNHQVRAVRLGLGLPQRDKYRIPQPQSSSFHNDESSSSYSQTESSLYPSDCAPSDTDYSQTSSMSSHSTRSSHSRKNPKHIMNKTYVIEPVPERQPEPSILEKSTIFDQTDLRSYTGFMPVLSSTFAGNLTQQTNIEPCADDASSCADEESLTSAVQLNRHLRNKQNNANEKADQNSSQKGILKNSSYHQACSTSLQLAESDTTITDSPRNEDVCNISLATDGNTTLGTRPSPVGAYSYELTQNNTTLRRQMKVRFEDVSRSSDGSCDSYSSQKNFCERNDKPRVKRFSKKPPTPVKTPRSNKSVDSSSDSEVEQSRKKKSIRRQVSFADSVRDQDTTPSDIDSPFSGGSDTSLWLENSNEVFVDYETERQARLAAMDQTQMVEIEESVVSEDNHEEPVLKLPWLPQLAFDITEDSFKATLKELEKVENNLNADHNMTYNDNFALIATPRVDSV
jgi:hypothetical protein